MRYSILPESVEKEKTGMQTHSSLLEVEGAQDRRPSPVERAIRSLVSLMEHMGDSGAETSPCSEGTERVLMDTEVDGARYLLIRMPPVCSRVQLSPREQEIVRMVAQGHPNKVIADVLNISTWTVCTHLRRIFAKLGVGSRAAMVAQMFEVGEIRKEHPAVAYR